LARLRRDFFEEDAPQVGNKVIGMLLVRVVDRKRLSGAIVEAEAYRGAKDPASHAYRRKTGRNEVMFGEPGRAYVYFTYGNHFCLNLTCEPAGVPAAVLVRAIEPREGIEEMKERRGVQKVEDVASGPGKLTKALAIGRDLNGEDLVTSDRLFVEEGERPRRVRSSSRIGISSGTEYMWRFFVEGSPFVSRGRPSGKLPQNP
jgi:DNA-3-methyladenine glycosylase